MPSYHLHAHDSHTKWSRAIPPTLTVPSGSIITLDLPDASTNHITPANSATALSTFSIDQANPLVGPVYVEGARPGDVLRVDVLELETAAYGWTAIFPDFGLLADEFTQPELKMWDLSRSVVTGRTEFTPGIEIPVRPFLGMMGVAPDTDEELSTIPPYVTGGNVDCRHLTAGSSLYLPVKVPGALFSCGDGHAAQGDGEVCGSAIETPMKATLRLTLERGMPWVEAPQYVTPPSRAEELCMGEYAAMGVHSDLLEATRAAVRGLMGWLVGEKGLTRVDAYMLASVAANIKVAEVVNMPNYTVSCSIPLSIFR